MRKLIQLGAMSCMFMLSSAFGSGALAAAPDGENQ